MTDFSTITACGECCTECRKKLAGRCPGCIKADGRVPEWAESGRCKVHACTREHQVQFCGLCPDYPCDHMTELIPWNPGIQEHMTALKNEYRKTLEIIGDNYFGNWTKTRTACRGIVIRDNKLLLSYETVTGQWMLPGGGLEPDEDEPQCCIREIAEETGYLTKVTDYVLEIDEYYESFKWVNRYFLGEIIGQTDACLTEREKEVGMEPRWLPLDEIISIFSKHASYADTDEMRRGMYLREYTALSRLCGGVAAGAHVILLNGPSSSGKSTLAKALRARLAENGYREYEVVSIDDYMHGSPQETIYEDDVFAISVDLCLKALEMLERGSGVIIDHVITSERIFRQLREMLAAYPFLMVNVTCSLDALRERELARGDRCPGSAEASAKYLYPKEGYDLAVDTSRGATEENAQEIITAGLQKGFLRKC